MAANQTSDFFGVEEQGDQSTRFPVHVEALGRLLGKDPDDDIGDINGFTFPKIDIRGDKTETLVEQPGKTDNTFTFPQDLLKLPLLVYAYKGTGRPLGGGETPGSSERKYDDNYEKHMPNASGSEARWKDASVNPIPNKEIGQQLLDTAYADPKKPGQLFNYYNGSVIKFRSSNDGYWHSYKIEGDVVRNIGNEVLKKFYEDGLITKTEYRKLIKT